MADPYLSDLDFDEDGIYRERHETGLTFSYFIPFIGPPVINGPQFYMKFFENFGQKIVGTL